MQHTTETTSTKTYTDLTGPEAIVRIEAARLTLQELVSDISMMEHIRCESPGIQHHAIVSAERWLRMAREDLQTGLMKIERAVLLPAKW